MSGIEQQMRAALTQAVRARDTVAVRALRTGLAALANAEAPPNDGRWVEPEVGRLVEHERLALSDGDRADLLRREVADRESAAEEYDGLGRSAEAAALRAEAAVLRHHLAAAPGEREA